MLDFLINFLRALLASLTRLFDRLPAGDFLRELLGGDAWGSEAWRGVRMLALAAVLGVLLLLLFLWVLRRGRGPGGKRRDLADVLLPSHPPRGEG